MDYLLILIITFLELTILLCKILSFFNHLSLYLLKSHVRFQFFLLTDAFMSLYLQE